MHHLGVVFLLLPVCFCLQVEWIAGAGATGFGNSRADEGSESPSSSEDYVQLLRSRGIGRIRLHDANWGLLQALGGEEKSSAAPIEVIVGMRNEEIVDVGSSAAAAHSWVAGNVAPHFPRTKIVAIAVGSDVLTHRQQEEKPDKPSLRPFLLPAMTNIHEALSSLGLESQIRVSAPQSITSLSSSIPPSSTAFHGDLSPLLDFLKSSGSFFMLNLCPLDLQSLQNDLEAPHSLQKIDDPLQSSIISIQSALQVDRNDHDHDHHSTMLNALVDAARSALATLHHPELPVVVLETGWAGAAATGAAAATFNADPVIIDRHHPAPARDPQQLPNPVERIFSRPQPMPAEGSFPRGGTDTKKSPFSSRRLMGALEAGGGQHGQNSRRMLANKSWCVANTNADTNDLQTALDWACGPGKADCSALQVGQSCYLPNTVASHASYAFNSYYQMQSWATGSCNFNGVAHTTTTDPSTASCLYTSSTSASGSPGTPTGTLVPSPSSVSSRMVWDRTRFFVTSLIFVFFVGRSLRDF